MKLRSSASLAGLTAMLSCTSSEPLPLPAVEAAATIIVVDDGRGELLTHAYEDVAPASLAMRGGTTVLVAHFDRPLDALGLMPGRVRLAIVGDEGRPLPSPSSVFVSRNVDGTPEPFAEAGADHELFLETRRPSVPFEDCLDAGGCYSRDEDIDARICTLPCSVDPPAGRMSPADVELPDFENCPIGWSRASDGPFSFCSPPARIACATHEAQWAKAAACVRVGTECPAPGEWSSALPTDRPIAYVRSGAVGGDGSRGSPLGSITAAIARGNGPRIVALSADVYTENIILDDGVTLFGACPESTVLEPPSGDAVRITAGTVGVQNLRVVAAARAIELRGGVLEVRDLIIEGDGSEALFRSVGAATIDAERLSVRGRGEAGLLAADGARVVIRNAAFDLAGNGLWATGPRTTLEAEDVAVTARAGGIVSRGVFSQNGASVKMRSSVFVDHLDESVAVNDGASFDGEWVFAQPGDGARNVVVWRALVESRLSLNRAVARDVSGFGAQFSTSTATLSDVLFVDGTGTFVIADSGATVQLTRVAGVRSGQNGLFVRDEATLVRADDLTFTDPMLDGIEVGDGAALELRGVSITNAAVNGINFDTNETNPPTLIEDVRIDRVGASSGSAGVGIQIRGGVFVTIRRAELYSIAGHGIVVANGSTMVLEDLLIDGAYMGVRTDSLSMTTARRLELRHTRATSLCVKGDSRAMVEDVLIEDPTMTRPEDPQGTFCAIGVPISGSGIMANNVARLDLVRYVVRRAPGIGMAIRGPTSLSASHGLLDSNRIGMQIAAEVRLPEVMGSTAFVGNEVTLDVQ